MNTPAELSALTADWTTNPRWQGIKRPYSPEEVIRLRGSVRIEHTLARLGAEKLWQLMNEEPFVRALGALSGGQAVQMVEAGLQSIYVSGWQVAAEANDWGQVYPDQSLYPVSSVPNLVKRIQSALMRADQIQHSEGRAVTRDYLVPLVADAEAGFGGLLNAYELMKALIEAGAAGVHFEDQLSSEKKCGHLGGKVLVPTLEFIHKLIAARLAADVLGVPTLLIARTDANSATLLTSDFDERDRPFIVGKRSYEGFYHIEGGIDYAIARALAYAPYADLIWCETATPDMAEARAFAEAVHAEYPGKMLAYNCSPSFNWRRNLSEAQIASFQEQLGAMGYAFQFITLAGFHSLHSGMYELARGYAQQGMTAFVGLQQREFELEQEGFRAVKHQSFVGTGYFDTVQMTVTGGLASTVAIAGSTEAAQFHG